MCEMSEARFNFILLEKLRMTTLTRRRTEGEWSRGKWWGVTAFTIFGLFIIIIIIITLLL